MPVLYDPMEQNVRPSEFSTSLLPVLVFMYVRLAWVEEREALAEFGEEYERYMGEVPAFIPRLRASRTNHGRGRG